MTNEEYRELGINPDEPSGYECPHCGYEPTRKELDSGNRCDCKS